ncbi:MAG: GNAT family N-acetyltransferase [Richelia sp. RM2_1_2]|nr:GNAT family N-acetyltransferase [Richelia sp. RM2_1_2]
MNLMELFEDTSILKRNIASFKEYLKGKYPLTSLELFITNIGDLEIASIIVDKSHRKEHVGTNVINEISAFADNNNLRIVLTPGIRDKHHGTTSRDRLVKFYKGFGFIANSGRNKDFTISNTLYRNPKR